MAWEIDLKARIAETSGFVVKFSPVPAGIKCGSECFRDPEGIVWRGKVTPDSAAIRNEAMRLRMLYEAADSYSKAMRKAIDPFPSD